MKKIKVWLMMALCAVIASCTANEEEGLGMNDSQTIVLRIGSAADTKAVGDPGTVSGTSLKNGYLFFVNKNGAIRRCYKLLDDGSSSAENLQITVGDIQKPGGYTFNNVPGDISQVYILGNVPESGGTTETNIRSKTTLTGVQAIKIQVTDQTDFSGVTMDGIGNVEGEGTTKTVTVNLTVLCSRLEIPSLKAGGDIKSYKVKGVYVSHFYTQMPLNETVSGDDLIKLTTENKNDNYNASTGTYKCMADINDSGWEGANGTPLSPAMGDVWGYQFIPGKSGGRVGIRVVIELSDITSNTEDQTYSGTQYLNIRGLVTSDPGTADPKPMDLVRGKIYSMGTNLTFDEGDLSPIPNPEDIKLTVTVKVNDWIPETVYPIL